MHVLLYVEARRRLTEKARSRGFWPIKGKGGGKGKQKGKTSPFRARKTLAERIAQSDCRYCGARGHWRAECPKRLAEKQGASNAAKPTNMMIMEDDDDVETDEIFMVGPVHDDDDVIAAAVQDRRTASVDQHPTSHFSHKLNRHNGESG